MLGVPFELEPQATGLDSLDDPPLIVRSFTVPSIDAVFELAALVCEIMHSINESFIHTVSVAQTPHTSMAFKGAQTRTRTKLRHF